MTARHDPPNWPKDMTPDDKLRRLTMLSPEARAAVDVLVDAALRDVWPTPAKMARMAKTEKSGRAR